MIRLMPRALVQELDRRCFHVPLKSAFSDMRNPSDMVANVALSMVGIRESSDNSGEMVSLIQSVVGESMGEAWCLSFVQACIGYIEALKNIKSTVPANEHVQSFFNHSPDHLKSMIPSVGAIACWSFGNTSKGHCGVVIGFDKAQGFNTIEGNTSSGNLSKDLELEKEREGDGVYLKKRSLITSEKFKLMGFVRPFPSTMVV